MSPALQRHQVYTWCTYKQNTHIDEILNNFKMYRKPVFCVEWSRMRHWLWVRDIPITSPRRIWPVNSFAELLGIPPWMRILQRTYSHPSTSQPHLIPYKVCRHFQVVLKNTNLTLVGCWSCPLPAFSSLFVYGCFAYMCICVPCACLVPAEAKRGH